MDDQLLNETNEYLEAHGMYSHPNPETEKAKLEADLYWAVKEEEQRWEEYNYDFSESLRAQKELRDAEEEVKRAEYELKRTEDNLYESRQAYMKAGHDISEIYKRMGEEA